MANDDRTTDHFIREVDEELRRDFLRSLWERLGVYFIAACVLVVAATGGYRGWTWWEQKQAAERGDQYLTAIEALAEDDPTVAASQFEALVPAGGGYGVLARLQLAAAEAGAGNTDSAIAAFDSIANDSAVDTVLRDLARLRAGTAALDAGDIKSGRERIGGLDTAGNPWRHAAREILGLAAYSEGDLADARSRFSAIQQDAEAPAGARQRAGAMVSLIDGIQAPPSPTDEGDTKSPE